MVKRLTIANCAAVLAALWCGTAPAVAAGPENLVRATPELAALAGFGPDEDVWVPATNAAPEPQNWYGSQPNMLVYAGTYFQPRVSTLTYNQATGGGEMVYQSGDVFVDGHIFLPTGTLLDSYRWWASDSVASDASFFLIRSCLPAAGPGTNANTVFGPTSTTGTGGPQTGVVTFSPALQIDNNTCSYFIRVNLGGAGIILQRARLQWRRQVSPAPVTATFGDVPVGDPIHRFVEALAAAGITGGCGGGNYCPNSPLTRGQMAVFLAAALGLHFPN
jgi:hypothetical protein